LRTWLVVSTQTSLSAAGKQVRVRLICICLPAAKVPGGTVWLQEQTLPRVPLIN
jgi:hypothetical protein